MKRAAAIAAICSACSSPTVPTRPTPTPEPPPAVAALASTGRLSSENCVPSGEGFVCEFFGSADNTGDGCATNVRGVTSIYRPKPNDAAIAWSAPFTYNGGMVRAKERFTYRGSGLQVGTEDGWTYATAFTWDNVKCS